MLTLTGVKKIRSLSFFFLFLLLFFSVLRFPDLDDRTQTSFGTFWTESRYARKNDLKVQRKRRRTVDDVNAAEGAAATAGSELDHRTTRLRESHDR